MPDILHSFPVNAPLNKVFDAVSTPDGLNQWWTLRSAGQPELGAVYELFFAENYDWRAKVVESEPPRLLVLQVTDTRPDWQDTIVSFMLTESGEQTNVRFEHRGWPEENDHFRTSSFCWAMYLRIMKRYVEFGETVEYGTRLSA